MWDDKFEEVQSMTIFVFHVMLNLAEEGLSNLLGKMAYPADDTHLSLDAQCIVYKMTIASGIEAIYGFSAKADLALAIAECPAYSG